MQGDTGEHAVSGVLAHQAAPIVWVAFVKHRYDVHVQPAALEVDADAVLLGNELVPVMFVLASYRRSASQGTNSASLLVGAAAVFTYTAVSRSLTPSGPCPWQRCPHGAS